MPKQRPIHERVHDHVKAAGLTYAQLAAQTGWSEQRVYRVLSGRTDLSAEDMELLARILKKTVAELYGDCEAKAS
jgi:transcriptional regulator with XRE-family HTH domain